MSGAVIGGRLHDAVGVTTNFGEGCRASVVCTFAPGRSARTAARLLALMRDVVGPLFARGVAARLSARAAADARPNAGTASSRQVAIAARMLDVTHAPALLCDADGHVLHESASLSAALRDDVDGCVRGAMLKLAVAAAGTSRPFEPTPELAVTAGRFVARCQPVTHGADEASLFAVTLDRASGRADVLGRAVAALGARHGLTDREIEVAGQLAIGAPNADIAMRLGISVFTARHHTERVLQKLGLRSRAAVPRAVLDRTSGEWRVPAGDDLAMADDESVRSIDSGPGPRGEVRAR